MQIQIKTPSILVCNKPVDFRKSIDGLVDIVLGELDNDVKKHAYLFYNRARDRIKLLAWHKTGFILLLKRLEEGRFFSHEGDLLAITPEQLSWLLAGLNWVAMSSWGELEYSDFR